MKSSGELEKEFVDNMQEITGKDLKTWLADIKKTGIVKRNDIINWLKKENGFGHVNASWLAGIYLNNGKLVYQNEKSLLEDQLAKREEMRPIFEEISRAILAKHPDAEMIPKKTYVSFTAKREFVAINIMTREVRVGLDLGADHPLNGEIVKSKLTGPMPRLSHMVTITSVDQVEQSLLLLIQKSYSRVN